MCVAELVSAASQRSDASEARVVRIEADRIGGTGGTEPIYLAAGTSRVRRVENPHEVCSQRLKKLVFSTVMARVFSLVGLQPMHHAEELSAGGGDVAVPKRRDAILAVLSRFDHNWQAARFMQMTFKP